MEKLSTSYLSEPARDQIRKLYSGQNDSGLYSYALNRKLAERQTGIKRGGANTQLAVSRLVLRVLDEVSNDTLQQVDRVVAADAGQFGKFHSI